ncbi:MAG TPA: AAA family ATPase [Thermoleophilaceae bacterium]|nr:AAA family ATPase [Thermoleophilaceae bacterium]
MSSQKTAGRELLERERELDVLGAVLSRARDGAGGVVVIEGPVGVGKSRLLTSARSSARDAGMRVVEARGAVLERQFAFGMARQLFEQVALAAKGAEAEQLFAGAAGLAARLVRGAGPATASREGETDFGSLHGLYWLTVNLADAGPLVLAVDDAQWVDASSLRFLGYLSRRIEGLPVALIVAGRSSDPEGTSIWRELADDASAEILRPRPLSNDATCAVVRDGLGQDAEPELCDACHRATGGNPLFLRELVAALAHEEEGPASLAAGAVSEVGPPAVGRFVLRRLERLGPESTALAQALAVLGEEQDIGLVAQTAGLQASEARAAADLLVQADVLVHAPSPSFAHPIVRAAVYEDMLPGERSDRHLAVARLLDESGAPAERVATHLLQCAPSGEGRWVSVLRRAATDAEQRGAPSAAVTYLRRALDEPPPDTERAELLCELGRWELNGGEYESSRAHLLEALAAPADRAVHARAATWLGRSAIAYGGPETAAPALAAITGLIEGEDDELALELEAEALTLTRVELALRGEVGERLWRFEQRAAGNARFQPVAQIHSACERMAQIAPADSVADAIEDALAAGPPANPFAFGMAIDALVTTERHTAAARWLDLALEVSRAQGLGPRIAGLHAQRALLGLATGAVGEAELDAETALDLAEAPRFVLPRIAGVAIRVFLERGRLDAAAAVAERHGEQLAGERALADEYLAARGRLRIARGDLREGLADLLHCGGLLDKYQAFRPTSWRCEAAAALVELGDRERAEQLAREAVAAARSFGAPGQLGHALRGAGRVIGGDEGLGLLEEATAVVEPSPARLESAYALADLGVELIQRRRKREGREALRLALEQALKCGATALAERIRGDLGAGGGRPPRLELSGVDALTPAERRVCDLAARELTNRQIAQTLFVTEKTVELHLTNAYRKLGIRSRFQLAAVMPAPASSA